ncbi:nuclease-related domain-containing DEAD/DEAH box helicase [Cellulomonas fimi]|uniref:DNA 3'-5' helicase n=1 Tax=Cellulomonas fimi TaxID=1708 RepID=A0A7Y0QIG6_CELFI|nr:UvrD-helicase domain-containing protein [Cellulomonas fimi]NMR20252.1 UvrD-helicase domain-containing protein [Cellulomonas fimi]
MPAGDSAGAEARRQLALADAHANAAAEARAKAARFGIAELTERRTAATLAPLSGVGYHLLADRGWPGSRTAQVDLVVVGPGGVFIVDTKAWRDVSIQGDRVLRGQDDVTDDLLALADLGYAAEAEFAEVGLAPGEVRPVVVLAGRHGINERVGPVRIVGEKDALRHIASHGTRLTPAQVDSVLARALSYFPQVGASPPVNVAVPEPLVPSPAGSFEQEALLSEDEVQAALLEGILASPIEEWMSFLHPGQAKLVRRSFNGPARIRGSAGTGKTVVGLHRAAYLARTRPGTVLVTTFVRTLPGVMRQTLARLAPDVVDQVEFASAHRFALGLLKERGVTVNLQPQQARNAFERAWREVASDGALGRSSLERRYWEEEIDYVLKGRGITRFEQYADLTRTGRRHRLTVEQRRAVWALFEAYTRELRARRVHDYQDVILLADAELRRQPLDRYSAVVVDEAQDFSCAMVRMMHALVRDSTDGLTLIGDGQQSIYPGGYTLAEAGVSLAGRGVVLDINYRNTAEILAFASRMVDGDEFADIEGVVARGDVPGNVARTGPDPVIEQCVNRAERDRLVVGRVRSVTATVGTSAGDVGVLCVTAKGVERAADALRAAGFPVVLLSDYDGAPVDAVKVGTIKRAKGLEFKQVLLADVRADQLAGAEPPREDASRERWQLLRRELYVAMTRARDGLWLGVI